MNEPLAIAFGANLGGDEAIVNRFDRCYSALCEELGAGRKSSLYRSAPVGPVAEQPAFLNAVAVWSVPAELDASRLLARLNELEAAEGRVRDIEQGPRQMDLDLVFAGALSVNELSLQLPHPRWRERAFVLRPLIELLGGEFRLSEATPPLATLASMPELDAQKLERWLPW